MVRNYMSSYNSKRLGNNLILEPDDIMINYCDISYILNLKLINSIKKTTMVMTEPIKYMILMQVKSLIFS